MQQRRHLENHPAKIRQSTANPDGHPSVKKPLQKDERHEDRCRKRPTTVNIIEYKRFSEKTRDVLNSQRWRLGENVAIQ